MDIQKDDLVTCGACEGSLCYQQVIDEHTTTWMCFNCGWSSSTAMYKGSPAVNNILKTAPDLYKDILIEDRQGRIWAPATIVNPEVGMVFVDGTTASNWRWASVKAIPLTKRERRRPERRGHTHKMDMKSIKYFERNEFLEAMDYANLLGESK